MQQTNKTKKKKKKKKKKSSPLYTSHTHEHKIHTYNTKRLKKKQPFLEGKCMSQGDIHMRYPKRDHGQEVC